MAIRSFRVLVSRDEYLKVGDNVTSISIIEDYVGWFRVIVTDVGDSQPAVDEADYIYCNGTYDRNGDAVDVWVMSTGDDMYISGESV